MPSRNRNRSLRRWRLDETAELPQQMLDERDLFWQSAKTFVLAVDRNLRIHEHFRRAVRHEVLLYHSRTDTARSPRDQNAIIFFNTGTGQEIFGC